MVILSSPYLQISKQDIRLGVPFFHILFNSALKKCPLQNRQYLAIVGETRIEVSDIPFLGNKVFLTLSEYHMA